VQAKAAEHVNFTLKNDIYRADRELQKAVQAEVVAMSRAEKTDMLNAKSTKTKKKGNVSKVS
jgi:hypothetical protein